MYQLKRVRPGFLDLSVELPTIVAFGGLSALEIDLFAYLCPPKIVDIWPPQIPEERSTFLFWKQNSRATLTSIRVQFNVFRNGIYLADGL